MARRPRAWTEDSDSGRRRAPKNAHDQDQAEFIGGGRHSVCSIFWSPGPDVSAWAGELNSNWIDRRCQPSIDVAEVAGDDANVCNVAQPVGLGILDAERVRQIVGMRPRLHQSTCRHRPRSDLRADPSKAITRIPPAQCADHDGTHLEEPLPQISARKRLDFWADQRVDRRLAVRQSAVGDGK